MESNLNMLHIVPFSKFEIWDVKRYFNNNEKSSKFQLVKLSNLLKQVNNYEVIKKDKEYNLCGLSAYGNGLFHRETKKGIQIKGKKLNKITQGQFIYSRLGANNGAFDFVSAQFNGYYVTNEFPVFSLDKSLNIEYLSLIFKLNSYWESISRQLQGAAHKRFKENLLLDLEIPLPTIDFQLKLVRNFRDMIALADGHKKKANDLEILFNSYLFEVLGVTKIQPKGISKGLSTIKFSQITKWALSHSLKTDLFHFDNEKFKTYKIKNLITFFEGGKTPSKARKDYWGKGFSWCSPKDFNGDLLHITEDEITDKAIKEAGMKVFPKGTLLSVFRSGILRHSFPTMITNIDTTINQDLKAYNLDENIILKEYYLNFIKVFKEYVLIKASKKSVTVESINTEDFLELNIIVPPLTIQKEIINKTNLIQGDIRFSKAQAEEIKNLALIEFEKQIFEQ
jgi:type I restriction enzyme S subunit